MPLFAKCFTELLPRPSGNDPYEMVLRAGTEQYTSCAPVRPWGSKVQRRDCIGSAKEQTSTDTLYLHDFMSNQPALPRANCLFLKPIQLHSVKFYSNNHSFSAYQLRFCGAVQTRHGNVYIRVRRTLFQRSLRCSRYMDTILLLRFDETYEPTFRRLHYAKPFSYVHLTVSSTNEMERGGGNIFNFTY